MLDYQAPERISSLKRLARIDKDPTPIQVANYVSKSNNSNINKSTNPNINRNNTNREDSGNSSNDNANKNAVKVNPGSDFSASILSGSNNMSLTNRNNNSELKSRKKIEKLEKEEIIVTNISGGESSSSDIQTTAAAVNEMVTGLAQRQGWNRSNSTPIEVSSYIDDNVTVTLSNAQAGTSNKALTGKNRIRYTLQDDSEQDGKQRIPQNGMRNTKRQDNDLQSKISNSENLIVKINRALSGEDNEIGEATVKDFDTNIFHSMNSENVRGMSDSNTSEHLSNATNENVDEGECTRSCCNGESNSDGGSTLGDQDQLNLPNTNEYDPEGLMKTFVGDGEMINNLEYFINTMTRGERGEFGDDKTNTILLYERMIFDLKCEVSYLKKMLLILLKCR